MVVTISEEHTHVHVGAYFFRSSQLRIILAHFLSPPPFLDVNQIRGQWQSLLPPPHYSTRLRSYREKDSGFSSLVNLRRSVQT